MRHASVGRFVRCFVTLVLVTVVLAARAPSATGAAAGAAAGEEETPQDLSRLPAAAKGAVDFRRDVLPILEKNCFSCHGKKRNKAGLRLDVEKLARQGGDSGPAFLPGNSAGSRLIIYVAGLDDEVVMPPRGERLNARQIGILRAWIDQGAKWSGESSEKSTAEARAVETDHWAYSTPVRPALPRVSRRDWPRSPVDHFVRARLDSLGIEPSPPAGRARLIRRLGFDLLGLPPSPEEVEGFIRDESPVAYEKLVDRLLASPRFGERWGRHWLDLARYADSDGYEKDRVRPHAWRYRDWVIDAVNSDVPFDRFSLEQLAGDLLPETTLEQRVATGFHRNTLHNTEGGTDREEDRVKKTIDRVNTTATVWLGLTMGCCQCHSHKYDRLTQREFYGLFAFLNNLDEVDISAPLTREAEEYDKMRDVFESAREEHRRRLKERSAEIDRGQAAWEHSLSGARPMWSPLKVQGFTSEGGAAHKILADDSVLVSGAAPDRDEYKVSATTDLREIVALRIEALTHESLPEGGPGRAGNGNFVLSELVLMVGGGEEASPRRFGKARATHSQAGFDVQRAVDGKEETGWAIGVRKGKLNRNRTATFILEEPIPLEPGETLTFTLRQRHGSRHNLGHFRLAATTASPPAIAVTDAVWHSLTVPPHQRTAEPSEVVATYHRRLDGRYRELEKALQEHEKRAPAPPSTKAQTLAATKERRKTHVHVRGDFLEKGDEVQPHTPAVLHPLNARGEVPDRIDLARWLFDPANPLTARVTANRIWGHLFGQGLVSTNDDFGVRGERPGHPELLDWLATELARRGWSRKKLIRRIVLSATYRQSSRFREDLLERDPENRLLARQNRFRAEAEIVRDFYLAASGLLDDGIGGPSVRPPLPAGVADLGYAGSVKWQENQGPGRYRRGMYTFFQRTVPYPMLLTFDAPESTVTCSRRERSNTPLQALTLLNDPVFVECAQALARRILDTGPAADRARIRQGFLICMGRLADDVELDRLQQLLGELREAAAQAGTTAAPLVGDHPPSRVATAEAASWTALCRILLNLDEFIMRE